MNHVIEDAERILRGINIDIEFFKREKTTRFKGSQADIDVELSLLYSRKLQYERALEVLRANAT